MSDHAEKSPMTAATGFEPARVNVRIKISALWTAMMFVFAYVDIFTVYRADFRAELEAGELGPFAINQATLLGVTIYVVLPALMVFGALVLRPRLCRTINIALSVAYALTIIAATIGEGYLYYLLGSAVEVALLAAIAYYAWTWPKLVASTSTYRPEVTAGLSQKASSH
jgi:cbb3-type cytochrome oxidase subunit 3